MSEVLLASDASPPAAALDPRRRVLIFSAVLMAAPIALAWIPTSVPHGSSAFQVPWWIVAVAFAAAELCGVRVEVRRESQDFNFEALALVLGLLLAEPADLVVGRVVGVAVAVAWQSRSFIKVTFNVAYYCAEAVAALVVYSSIAQSSTPTAVRTWLAIGAALVTSLALNVVSLNAVIRWHGGVPSTSLTVWFGALTALGNGSVAILAAVLLATAPAASAFLLVLITVVFVAYRGYIGLQQRYASLQLLYDFTKAVGAAQRAESVLAAILQQAREVLRAEVAEIWLTPREAGEGAVLARAEYDGAATSVVSDTPLCALTGEVVASGDTVLVSRPASGMRAAQVDELGVRDCIVTALQVDGGIIGYLLVGERMGELSTFDAQDAKLLDALANHAAMAIENGRLIERVSREVKEREYQAAHDSLTGLPNRAQFVTRLEAAIQGGDHTAVLLMDLDHFKDINDTLGHNVGDELLCQVAARISSAIVEHACVARLGGDEFAVLVPGITDRDGALDSARTVRSVLAPAFHVGEVALEAGASIGVALAPEHGADPHTLLRRADVAMYVAKREPTGVAIYDQDADGNTIERLALVGALRDAIDREDLLVYFQPKVRIHDEQVIGAEALVRWQHPQHGMMFPDLFIGMAEKTGLVPALTTVVARKALQQVREWQHLGYDLQVAVNISVQSLLDENFPEQIARLLDECGVAPRSLTLEITESTVMDPDRTVHALERLAGLGIKLSVDDFGTGYSSLTYLQRLPVHEVKIDKSFVMSMGANEADATIVRSIVTLGHNLGLSVVAEGVEDRVSWDRLAVDQCDIAQGYYLSKPIPAQAFTEWLQAWQPKEVRRVAAVEKAVASLSSWR